MGEKVTEARARGLKIGPADLVLRVLLAALFGLALAACSSAPDMEQPGAAEDAPLTNTYWKLMKIGEDEVPAVDKNREPHLIFLDDGRVLGHTGCNTLNGQYGVQDGQVRFLAMGATRMACPDFRAAELAFIQALEQTRAIGVEGTSLRLMGDGNAVLAVLVAPHVK